MTERIWAWEANYFEMVLASTATAIHALRVTSTMRLAKENTELQNGLAQPFLTFISTPNRTKILDLVDFHPDGYNLLSSRTSLESIKSDLEDDQYIGQLREQDLKLPIGTLTSSISDILDGQMNATV